MVSIWKSYVASFSSYRIHKLEYPRLGDDKSPSAFNSWGVKNELLENQLKIVQR